MVFDSKAIVTDNFVVHNIKSTGICFPSKARRLLLFTTFYIDCVENGRLFTRILGWNFIVNFWLSVVKVSKHSVKNMLWLFAL